jgi:hypothetical protein
MLLPDNLKESMKLTKSVIGILVITASLATQGCAQNWPTNGLVAYYPFNGNAKDASGNGHDGFAEQTFSTTNQLGQANSALGFAGHSWVYIPYSPSLFTTNYSISVMARFTLGPAPLTPRLPTRHKPLGISSRASSMIFGFTTAPSRSPKSSKFSNTSLDRSSI